MDEPGRFLNPPSVPAVRYQRNFIKTAVCELRFPTLLELEAKPPHKFQAKIRKNYPFYEPQVIEQVGGPHELARELRYLFRSKDQQWTITVKSFSLAVETSKYLDFEDFFGRFTQVLASAKDMIDADFLTRVGLRYINLVPIEDGNLEGWIRSDLILPITGGVLGAPTKFSSLLQGPMEHGQYSVRHGLKEEEPNKSPMKRYLLDFDYFSENVELDAVESRIKEFNNTNFALFSWCLGDKAKRLLGEGKPK